MKASEFLMAKALEHDDFQLTKIAQDLYGTEEDIDYIDKEAGIASGLLAAGSQLLKSNVIRNAAIGAGVGSLTGAASAQSGNRLAGAFKGGLIGAVTGGIGSASTNILKTMKTPGVTFNRALAQEGNNITAVGTKASRAFDIGRSNRTFLNRPTPMGTSIPESAPKVILPTPTKDEAIKAGFGSPIEPPLPAAGATTLQQPATKNSIFKPKPLLRS
jgi:hypothetical protein